MKELIFANGKGWVKLGARTLSIGGLTLEKAIRIARRNAMRLLILDSPSPVELQKHLGG